MENYNDYLHSDKWRKKRSASLRFYQSRCAICNSDYQINVHHRTYENLGYENNRDLIVLCKECHSIFHNKLPVPKHKLGELPRIIDLDVDILGKRYSHLIKMFRDYPGDKNMARLHDGDYVKVIYFTWCDELNIRLTALGYKF